MVVLEGRFAMKYYGRELKGIRPQLMFVYKVMRGRWCMCVCVYLFLMVINKSQINKNCNLPIILLHLHSRFNIWLQLIGQKQLQDETRDI